MTELFSPLNKEDDSDDGFRFDKSLQVYLSLILLLGVVFFEQNFHVNFFYFFLLWFIGAQRFEVAASLCGRLL